MPNKPISPEAAAITGITVVGNQMLYNKERVMHKSQFQALNDFIIYLSTFSKKPILVGHNIKRFDCHVLYNSLKSHILWNEFCSYVHCFFDSLDLFKHVKPGLKSYSQTNLVHELLGETYEAHNAIDDTAILNKLISTKCDFDLYVQTLSFSCLYPYFCFLYLCNLKTFSTVIKKKVMSKAMALKAAKSNLKLCHLRTATNRKGLAGLKALLSETTEQGSVRVTSSNKIINRIFEFLSENKQG